MYTTKKNLSFFSFIFLAFTLCAQSDRYYDFSLAQPIVAEGSYLVSSFYGAGNDVTELVSLPCLKATAQERNSHWFSFVAKESQLLYFSIAPLGLQDDLDFGLYEIKPNGDLVSLRCNVAGRTLCEAVPMESCLGVIGLGAAAKDMSLEAGCAKTAHFLAPVLMEKGKIYALLVHNVDSDNGFTLNFGQGNLSNTTNETVTMSVGEVFPNPTSESASLPVVLPMAAMADVLLLRANGQVLGQQPVALVAGQQNITIDLTAAAREMVYVRLMIDGQVFYRRIVKE